MASGDPSVHVLDGVPPVFLSFDPRSSELALRVPTSDDVAPATELATVEVRILHGDSGSMLEVATKASPLHQYFYLFALSIADGVQLDGLSAAMALVRSVAQWRDLLRPASALSTEEQTGLLGELWLVQRLAGVYGAHTGLMAWTGPRGEAHDFRIQNREFEVKATRSEHRVHWINGLTQLARTPNRRLFLLSIQFTSAGAAPSFSLSSRIAELTSMFDQHHLSTEFHNLLTARYGLTQTEWRTYAEALELRSAPRLLEIRDQTPQLLPDDIAGLAHQDMDRVKEVRYRLDIDGIGSEDGTPDFLATIPEA